MTNKEKLKGIIEQDINPKDYYNKIIGRIEKGEKMKNKNIMWKWSLVPVCLVMVIIGGVVFNYQGNSKSSFKDGSYIDKNNNVMLNINELNENVGMTRIDADIKVVDGNNVNFPVPYKNGIDIPEDLDKTYMYVICFKEDKNSEEYGIIGNYETIYSNEGNRSINIKYSKDYKPVRDYYFNEDGSKITIINDTELKIYKYNDIYFTEFSYNDYNFDIETSNISEQELSTLLVSILK